MKNDRDCMNSPQASWMPAQQNMPMMPAQQNMPMMPTMPNMMPFPPMQGFPGGISPTTGDLENRVLMLERQVKRLEARVSRLETPYPTGPMTSTGYQSAMPSQETYPYQTSMQMM